jgi:signal transduction histidine kinase
MPNASVSPGWRRILGEARTRILMLYLLLILIVTAIAVPIFQLLFLANVDNRVRADLVDEMADFQTSYTAWEALPNQSQEDLRLFAEQFLSQQVPQDDNFLIFLIDNQFYKSNPEALPASLKPDSAVAQRWLNVKTPSSGEYSTSDPNIGSILYRVQPLVVDNQMMGTFVSVHTTAGERQEALAGVGIFMQVALGVVTVSFALAWMATGKLLAPVRHLATTARSVSESDLSQRLHVAGSGEIADLANTFNAMLDRLQVAFTSQRNFINDAGHELRTPITIIRGHLELLTDDFQEQQETLELVIDELDRMSRFVNDMILLAKAEQSHFLQLESIDISPFMAELFAKVQALADRNWRLRSQGEGHLVGDPQRLTGAMMNLVQNAVQHTQPGDLIELGHLITKQEVRLWVRDSGLGINPSDQQRIFERFARAAHSYRRSDGAGLGLAIVRVIVEAHGGRVMLSSRVGAGSTFTIILPFAPRQ